MRKCPGRVLFLLCVLLLGQAFGDSYEIQKIDGAATTLRLLELSLLTLLPLAGLVTVSQRPGFPVETVVSISLLSIPALIGWPIFFFELGTAKKKGIPISAANGNTSLSKNHGF